MCWWELTCLLTHSLTHSLTVFGNRNFHGYLCTSRIFPLHTALDYQFRGYKIYPPLLQSFRGDFKRMSQSPYNFCLGGTLIPFSFTHSSNSQSQFFHMSLDYFWKQKFSPLPLYLKDLFSCIVFN